MLDITCKNQKYYQKILNSESASVESNVRSAVDRQNQEDNS